MVVRSRFLAVTRTRCRGLESSPRHGRAERIRARSAFLIGSPTAAVSPAPPAGVRQEEGLRPGVALGSHHLVPYRRGPLRREAVPPGPARPGAAEQARRLVPQLPQRPVRPPAVLRARPQVRLVQALRLPRARPEPVLPQAPRVAIATRSGEPQAAMQSQCRSTSPRCCCFPSVWSP